MLIIIKKMTYRLIEREKKKVFSSLQLLLVGALTVKCIGKVTCKLRCT
jgi:hypothetical protein